MPKPKIPRALIIHENWLDRADQEHRDFAATVRRHKAKVARARPTAVPLDAQATQFLTDLIDYMSKGNYTGTLDGIVGAKGVNGRSQDDEKWGHVFVYQIAGVMGDDYSGNIYIPIGHARYLKTSYQC